MSLGVNRYRRVLPLQNVSRGLFLIPRGLLALAGSQQHSYSRCPRSSRCSTPRCLVRPSPRTRRLTTHTPTSPGLETVAEDGETPPKFMEKLASVPVRPHGRRESVLVKSATVYPTRKASLAEENKRYLATRRQRWLEGEIAKHRHNPRAPTDWRYILRLLSDYTPAYSTDGLSKAVKIIVPPEAKHLFEPPGRASIKLIADRSNCQAVIHEAESPTEPDHILVTGFYTCVEEATDEIFKLDSRVKVVPSRETATFQAPGKETTDLYRQAIALHHRQTFKGRIYNLQVRADEIPRPSTWTKESFEHYVTKLVKSRMTPDRVSKFYPVQGSHERAVISILLELFADVSVFSLITPQVFHMALAYMARMTHNTSWARRLLQSMHSRGFKADSQTMHLLLEGTTKDKSLSDFQVLLEQMVHRRLSPTLWTWILFLRHIKAEDLKRHALFLMDKKGLLDVPGAIRLAALEMAEHDAYRGAQLGLDGESFITQQTELYGQDWAHTDTCNKIIHGLLLHDRVEVAFEVLKRAVPKGDDVTLNTLLTHALRKRDERIAISVLELFNEKGWSPTAVCDESFELLIKLAFKKQRPHMFSVVWRYANAQGPKTTFWMRRHVRRLMHGGRDMSKVVGWMLPKGLHAPIPPGEVDIRESRATAEAAVEEAAGDAIAEHAADGNMDFQVYAATHSPADDPPNLQPESQSNEPESTNLDSHALAPPGDTSPSSNTIATNPLDHAALRAFVISLISADQEIGQVSDDHPSPDPHPSRDDPVARAPTNRITSHHDYIDLHHPHYPLHMKLAEAYKRDLELRGAVAEGRINAELLTPVKIEMIWKSGKRVPHWLVGGEARKGQRRR